MSKGKQFRVLVLVPNGKGGIRRLFDQLAENGLSKNIELQEFTSTTNRGKSPFSLLLNGWKLYSLLKSGKFDLVHINLASKGSTYRKIFYSLACVVLETPYVIHLHGGGYPKFIENSHPIILKMIKRFFAKSVGVVVLGDTWSEFVTSKLEVPTEKVSILPNAVYAPISNEKERGQVVVPRILFTGRINAEKGIPQLVAALSDPEMLKQQWMMVFAGAGEIEYFSSVVAKNGIASRVQFTGWLDARSIDELLQNSDILVLPSLTENLPLSLLEGMGYGLFPIVTNVGAMGEVIKHEENGLIVPPNDVPALTQALIQAIASPILRQEGSKRARADFKSRYDIRDYSEKLVKCYESFGIEPMIDG